MLDDDVDDFQGIFSRDVVDIDLLHDVILSN